MKKLFTILAVSALSFNAFADHTPEHKTTDAKAVAPADMNANVKADMNLPAGVTPEQMAEAMKLTQPSDAHKKLDPFVGNWTYSGKMWMDPKQKKPDTMKGTTDNQWILEGRFVQQHAKGEAMNGMPAFEGFGTTGYDNVKKEYSSVWMDNMATGRMSATASYDEKAKSFNETGTYSCPIAKTTKPFRAIWKIDGKNSYKYTWFTTDANGKEFKSMEIAYKRAK